MFQSAVNGVEFALKPVLRYALGVKPSFGLRLLSGDNN
jgi:hypothetical protein